MGLSIQQMEDRIRDVYPNFSHVKVRDFHYIGRSNLKVMNSANQIGADCTYGEALRDALRTMKEEGRAARRAARTGTND